MPKAPKLSKVPKYNTVSGIFVLCIFLLVVLLVYYLCKPKPKSKSTKKKTTTIVIARYKEDLKWTLEEPFNQFQYTVYNKGEDENFEKKNVVRIIKLKNVGRDLQTYFHHIVTHYENLSDINIFLPGSLDLDYKKQSAKHMLNHIIKYNEACISLPCIPYVNKLLYHYGQKTYINSSNGNARVDVGVSPVRPFGKWYDTYFKEDLHYLSQFGIYSVSKTDIKQHEKSRYEQILRQLSRHINPEEGFFVEISMYQIFYPYNETIVETYYPNFISSIPSIVDKFFSFYYKNLL